MQLEELRAKRTAAPIDDGGDERRAAPAAVVRGHKFNLKEHTRIILM